MSHEGRLIPAASAIPANGTPLAEKNDFKASSKSSGEIATPPLLAVLIAANGDQEKVEEEVGELQQHFVGRILFVVVRSQQ